MAVAPPARRRSSTSSPRFPSARSAPDGARLRPQRPLRSEGTSISSRPRKSAGGARIVAQSIAFAYAPGPPGTNHREQDPLIARPAKRSGARRRRSQELEPPSSAPAGSCCATATSTAPAARSRATARSARSRRRRLPIVAAGTECGRSSTSRTPQRDRRRAHPRGPGAYNIVDDEPGAGLGVAPGPRRRRSEPGRPRRVPALARARPPASTASRS